MDADEDENWDNDFEVRSTTPSSTAYSSSLAASSDHSELDTEAAVAPNHVTVIQRKASVEEQKVLLQGMAANQDDTEDWNNDFETNSIHAALRDGASTPVLFDSVEEVKPDHGSREAFSNDADEDWDVEIFGKTIERASPIQHCINDDEESSFQDDNQVPANHVLDVAKKNQQAILRFVFIYAYVMICVGCPRLPCSSERPTFAFMKQRSSTGSLDVFPNMHRQ